MGRGGGGTAVRSVRCFRPPGHFADEHNPLLIKDLLT